MKLRTFLSSLLLATLTCTSSWADDTPLSEQMEDIKSAFRSLNRAIKDPAKMTDAIALVDRMITASEKSLDYEPAWTSEQPADEQAQFVENYRDDMNRFILDLQALRKALKAGEHEEAMKLAQSLRAHPKEGHKRYKKPDEE